MLYPIDPFHLAVGDTDAPLQFKLLKSDCTPWNLTGSTLQIRIVKVENDGTLTEVKDWGAADIDDAANGLGHYDFEASDVANPGTFAYWVRVVTSSKPKTFPPHGAEALILISATE